MKKLILIVLFSILIYTRFVNLSWGLPYPFHPDERNMAIAIQQLHCDARFSILDHETSHIDINECFNPHFFAYGQLPLYVANILVWSSRLLTWEQGSITSLEAEVALRILSALSAITTVIVLWKIITLYLIRPRDIMVLSLLTFVPVFIQMSHFGTTESMLMLFCSLLIYFSLRIMKNIGPVWANLICAAIVSGLALGTKVSSLTFIFIPLMAYLWTHRTRGWNVFFIQSVQYSAYALLFFILSSPHNFISFQEFLSSIRYESDVALGRVIPFYTRQFLDKPAIWFQSIKIFPYTLGWPFFVLFLYGFLALSWKDKRLLFLRFVFLVTFIPSAFFYAKWTRFLAPAFPVMMIIAVLSCIQVYIFLVRRLKIERFVQTGFAFVVLICILPGIAFLSIYQNKDVRIEASNWIYKEVPAGSQILTETANVVDIPQPDPDSALRVEDTPSYPLNSFDYYELDNAQQLPGLLDEALSLADYITVPSRRVFYNHTCYRDSEEGIKKDLRLGEHCRKLSILYPQLNQYYDNLFDGSLGFTQVAKFTSYPKIQLFGHTILEFPDEDAEETWTVFDHPVIRIYKRI